MVARELVRWLNAGENPSPAFPAGPLLLELVRSPLAEKDLHSDLDLRSVLSIWLDPRLRLILIPVGTRIMSKIDYRQNAANCLHLADQSSDPAIRMGLIDMAHAWLGLAEQAEKNSRADLVYKTSPSLQFRTR